MNFTPKSNEAPVFVVNPDGSFLSQVTDDPLGAGAIVWFPDGRHLAYMTLRSSELKVLDIQTGEIRSASSSDFIVRDMFTQAPHFDAAMVSGWYAAGVCER